MWICHLILFFQLNMKIQFLRVVLATFAIAPLALCANPVSMPNIEELLEKSKQSQIPYPHQGRYIFNVLPDSPAEKNALKNGSILSPNYVNEMPTFPDKKGTMTQWLSPTGEQREIPHPGGMWGFYQVAYHNMVYWYLNHGQRKDIWDKEVMRAIYSQSLDPKNVPNLWKQALAKGYKEDSLYHWSLACMAAYSQDKALFSKHLLGIDDLAAPKKPSDFFHRAEDWIHMGMLLGDMDLIDLTLETFSRKNDSKELKWSNQLLALSRKFPLPKESPVAQAERMKRIPFLKDAIASKKGNQLQATAAKVEHKSPYRFKPITYSPPIKHEYSLLLIPAREAANVDVQIEFKFTKNAMQYLYSPQDRAIKFGLLDTKPNNKELLENPEAAKFTAGPLAELGVSANALHQGIACSVAFPGKDLISPEGDGYVLPKDIGMNQFRSFPYLSLEPDRYSTLRIVKVGQWVELLMDGRRMALIPCVESVTLPSIYLKINSCEVVIQSLRGEILE